jgi:hypothetical protein
MKMHTPSIAEFFSEVTILILNDPSVFDIGTSYHLYVLLEKLPWNVSVVCLLQDFESQSQKFPLFLNKFLTKPKRRCSF